MCNALDMASGTPATSAHAEREVRNGLVLGRSFSRAFDHLVIIGFRSVVGVGRRRVYAVAAAPRVNIETMVAVALTPAQSGQRSIFCVSAIARSRAERASATADSAEQ